MRLAIISDSRRRGGAATATARVFDELVQREGWQSRWFVSQADGAQEKDTVVFTGPGVVRRAVQTLMGGEEPWQRRLLRLWAAVRNRRNLLRLVRQFGPDIISLHSINQWTDAALRRTVAADLCKMAPTVWTLHDMWPLTGYSDYPDEYIDCTLSPEEAWQRVFAQSSVQRETRILLACGSRLIWVAPSKWIGDLAMRQFPQMRVEHIPHGVDGQEFRPLAQEQSREWLDVPNDRPVVAAVAHSAYARRKGMKFLVEAVNQLSFPTTVILMGKPSNDWKWAANVRVVYLGYISDVRLLRAAYSAADVFVVPSLAEMFGLVAIEAMACGTPCVGFETGGMAETIRHGDTGFLVPRGDAQALAKGIERILQLPPQEKQRMRSACRKLAETEYDLRREVEHYAELLSECAARAV